MLRRFEEDANLSLTPRPLPAPELMVPFVATTRTPPEDSWMAFVAFPECHCYRLSSQDIVNYFEKYVDPSQEFALSCPICMSIFISLSKNEHLYIYTSLINRRTLGFGRCIERVETERPGAGQAMKHGIIVFMSEELRDEAMFQETAAFLRVNGHDTWVQLYMPLL